MLIISRRVVLLALLAATALLAPAEAATTDTMTTTSATDQDGNDEPIDSGLECSDDFAGDGQCDDLNNSAACTYDGGDCCECTCVPTVDFNCGGNYNCIDPDAECVDDDDGDGGVMTTLTIETDDVTDGTDDADEAATDTDSATESRPSLFVSAASLAAAAGYALLLAG